MNDQEAHDFYANPKNRTIAGPARKRKRPALTSMTAVRFEPGVIEAVKEIAHGEGITVSSWIRKAIQRTLSTPEPEMVDLDGPEAVRIPAAALRDLATALMPILSRHGSASLIIGAPEITALGPVVMTTQSRVSVDAPAHPAGLIEGSGRMGQPKALPSTRPHTFTCPHFSIGNVISASCASCGPPGLRP